MPDRSSDAQTHSAADVLVNLASMFSAGVIDDSDAVDAVSGPMQSEPEMPDGRVIAAYELALDVGCQESVPAVLRRLVDGARALVDASSSVLVYTATDVHEPMVVQGGEPLPGIDNRHPLDGLVDDGLPVAPMLVRDATQFPGIAGNHQGEGGIRSAVGVPLTSSGRQVGYLFALNPVLENAFTHDDLAALELVARHAASALRRAQAERGIVIGQHRIEAQLSQLRTIMDTLPAGVLVLVPPDGRVELANETALATILGDDRAEHDSLRVYRDFDWMRADGTELPRAQHPGMLALKGEMIGNRALTLQTKRGDQLPVRVQSTPIYGADGTVTRAVVLFLDVSRERAAEQVKDDFLSLISHEFRTPLTAIHGGALLLSQQGDVMDAETRHELLQDIGEESARLDRMLGNLLSVSEIMAGRFQAVTEPILVAPLVQPLIEEFRKKAQGHTFTLSVQPDTPPAEGAPELLIQIFRNLYENAVKYSPGGGEIRTVISQRGGAISVEVIDNGLGIAAEHVPHVFERFRRPGAEPTVRGMGLGLYLSRLLVDAQGGRIRANSPGPGHGATFVVELPKVSDWEHEVGVEAE